MLTLDSLITRFYAAFSLDPDRLRIPQQADLPGDMLTGEEMEPPWVRWKPVPGRVSKSAFKDWEEERGVHLPGSFRHWFLAKHTLDLNCGVVRLACSPSNHPFGDLEDLLEWDFSQLRDRLIFPIGDETLYNAGPLCLDLRGNVEDPPVVYWDAAREEISAPISSSFPNLLALASFAMEGGMKMFGDEAAMAAFLAIDPDGAGGPGKDYWTGEGDGEL